MPPTSAPTCRCGHGHDAHEHLRRGTDCAICGRDGCARFRAAAGSETAVPTGLRGLIDRLARRAANGAEVIVHPSARRPTAPPTQADGPDEGTGTAGGATREA